MMLFKESDILDEAFRKRVIKEIMGEENQRRKREQFKRYEIYHDRVAKYTEDLMAKQFDQSTIEEMKLSLTNVSLCKKIIDKIARVYSFGVERELESKRDMKKLSELERILCINTKMKKANRYLKLHKNIWVMCLPKAERDFEGLVLSYDLKVSVVPPFLFDVIEDADDREKAKCLIFSNFNPENQAIRYDAPERNGNRGLRSTGTNSFQEGDGVDQVIADTPNDYDPKNQKFKWWSDNYHFVTNQAGAIIDGPEDLINPIGVIPGISLNMDQDGNYYSIGGSDLVDSCLLANAMITNINHIGIQQGYGQAFMIGKNLPQHLRLGPTKVVKLEQSSENERPEFGFATSSPPLEQLKDLTFAQIALLLSTNNLSTSGVKVDLNSGMNFPSGIAMLIDKSESTEDVMDQAQLFVDNEPKLWEIIGKWISFYNSLGLLDEDLSDFEFDLSGLKLRIDEPHPIISESEKLDNLEKRKSLGISTLVDLIMIDNPQMSEEEARKKLEEIMEEKQLNMKRFVNVNQGQVNDDVSVGSDDNDNSSDLLEDRQVLEEMQ